MTESHAIQVVMDARTDLEIDHELIPQDAERCIVQSVPDPDTPAVPTDRVAWLVSLASDWASVEVSIDDNDGDILKVVRSA